jgi:hypothetical protein
MQSSSARDWRLPSFIEGHDGRLNYLQLATNPLEDAIVSFGHLVAYYDVGDERAETWSLEATLELGGVTVATWLGERQQSDTIMDAEILDPEGNGLRWESLLSAVRVSEVRFHLSSGLKIRIVCKTATLRLERQVRRLEDWIGPLTWR